MAGLLQDKICSMHRGNKITGSKCQFFCKCLSRSCSVPPHKINPIQVTKPRLPSVWGSSLELGTSGTHNMLAFPLTPLNSDWFLPSFSPASTCVMLKRSQKNCAVSPLQGCKEQKCYSSQGQWDLVALRDVV